MGLRALRALALVLVAGFALGCAGVMDAVRPGPALELIEAPAFDEPTEEQVQQLGSDFLGLLEKDEAEAWLALYDANLMGRMALAGRSIPPGFVESFIEGMEGAKSGMYDPYRRLVVGGATMRLLRTVKDERGHWAVIGAIFPDGAFNQFWLRVVSVDGTARWVDMWTITDARYISEGAVEALDMVLVQEGKIDPDGNRRIQALNKLNGLVLQGDYVGALDAYDAAPEDIRSLRKAHALRLSAATNAEISDERYLGVLNDFLTSFPDDPAGMVHALDRHALAGRWLEAGQGAEKLHGSYPDAYILVVASSSYHSGGHLAPARSTADRAVELEPTLMEAWVQQLLIASAQGDEAAVGPALEELGAKHGLTPAIFDTDPSWQALQAMPTYSRWAASLGG